MILGQHPTAFQMAKKKHLKAAFEATGLLLQAIVTQDSETGKPSPDQYDVHDAYGSLKNVMERNGMLRAAPKPASVRT